MNAHLSGANRQVCVSFWSAHQRFSHGFLQMTDLFVDLADGVNLILVLNAVVEDEKVEKMVSLCLK
jgi:hypothetical protein